MKLNNLLIAFFDKMFSFFGIILFIPIFIIVSIAVKMSSQGSIFFIQARIGKDLKKFFIFKFRTMHTDNNRFIGEFDQKLNLSQMQSLRNKFLTTNENDPRITKVGIFLRKTSLDELPQLINVLFGEMSFVGPRPDTPIQEIDYHPNDWISRHKIKPGITGLAQINGRSSISISERVKFDLDYVNNKSLKLYFKIIFITFIQVLLNKGTN